MRNSGLKLTVGEESLRLTHEGPELVKLAGCESIGLEDRARAGRNEKITQAYPGI